MLERLGRRLTYANVTATLSLFLVLSGGTTIALSGKNSVRSNDIAPQTIQEKDLGRHEVTKSKIDNKSVTGAKIAPGAVGPEDTGVVPAARLTGLGQVVQSGEAAGVVLDTDSPQFALGVDAGNNGVRIRVPGIYAIGGQLEWGHENGIGERGLYLLAPTPVDQDVRAASATGTVQSVYTIQNLRAGDRVSLVATQDSGQPLNIPGAGTTHLTVHWVGPCDGAC